MQILFVKTNQVHGERYSILIHETVSDKSIYQLSDKNFDNRLNGRAQTKNILKLLEKLRRNFINVCF